jgi:hypothetical protein
MPTPRKPILNLKDAESLPKEQNTFRYPFLNFRMKILHLQKMLQHFKTDLAAKLFKNCSFSKNKKYFLQANKMLSIPKLHNSLKKSFQTWKKFPSLLEMFLHTEDKFPTNLTLTYLTLNFDLPRSQNVNRPKVEINLEAF